MHGAAACQPPPTERMSNVLLGNFRDPITLSAILDEAEGDPRIRAPVVQEWMNAAVGRGRPPLSHRVPHPRTSFWSSWQSRGLVGLSLPSLAIASRSLP